MSSTVRRDKGRDREELLVEAAAAVIAERGLAHVRVADIAERAGMTPGHVTYYFPSKTELLVRAIESSEDRLLDELTTVLARVRDPWRRLERLLGLSAASGADDPGWVLWLQVWQEASLDDTARAAQERLDARWREILADVLRYGAERGVLVVEDADATALVLSSMVDGLSIQVSLGGLDRADMMRLLRQTARRLLEPA
ncbi:MAG TPA: TetR/AcrR family transcriptional regulator [Candidatus Nanopelagicales bacterium]|nr:TetR/AcrR family transcriptional regulator [Candidatus Nanopelagicales bacterium]